MLTAGAGALTLLLGALIALAPMTMDSCLASMPRMVDALSATPDEVQLTLPICMYAPDCAQLRAGSLADRYGRRPALLWGTRSSSARPSSARWRRTPGR
jgi:DHA1 family bicyclomycin/chloramphenicol resistance-like MFS transporter